MTSDSLFNNRNITADTEHTTAISTIAYDIEDLLVLGMAPDEIRRLLDEVKSEGDFPPDLELVDAFFNYLAAVYTRYLSQNVFFLRIIILC